MVAPRGKGETVGQEPTAGRATGPARQAPPGAMPNRGPASARAGRASAQGPGLAARGPSATADREEWSSRGPGPPDRIRLTGRPRAYRLWRVDTSAHAAR